MSHHPTTFFSYPPVPDFGPAPLVPDCGTTLPPLPVPPHTPSPAPSATTYSPLFYPSPAAGSPPTDPSSFAPSPYDTSLVAYSTTNLPAPQQQLGEQQQQDRGCPPTTQKRKRLRHCEQVHCGRCGKSMKADSMGRHLRLSCIEKKTVECDICGKKCSRPDSMKRHKKSSECRAAAARMREYATTFLSAYTPPQSNGPFPVPACPGAPSTVEYTMALGGQSAPSTSVDSGPSGVNSYYHGAELQMMYPPLPPDYVTHGYAQGVNGNVPNHQTDPYAARGLDTYQPAQDIIDPCLLDMIPDPLPEANGDISDRRPLTPDEFDALTASISGQWTVQGDIFY